MKLKNYLFCGASVLISGMIDGTVESINYHYEEGFKPRCPKANDKYWNPAVSWKNKYKNNVPAQGPKFAGSTTILVFTTDAYHMLRATDRTLEGVTLAYYINSSRTEHKTLKKRLLVIARDFLALSAVRAIGFHLTYSVIFKKRT